jgi:4-hydroxybenzoate polyprenyltransferase
MRLQVTTSTLLLLAGVALMVYAVYALQGMPHMYVPVLLWLCFVEYAVGRAWWSDVQDVYVARRARS